MPRQPKMALAAIFLTAGWLILQMGYSLIHQLRDVAYSSEFTQWIANAVRDVLHNHVFYERLYNGFIIYSMAVILYLGMSQMVVYVRLRRHIRKHVHRDLTLIWNRNYRQENMRIYVIHSPAFAAMSFGVLRPAILLSSGAIEKLTTAEMEAILFHEIYHCKQRHPLQMLVLTIASRGFAYVPLIKGLTRYYTVWMELMADRYAISRMNGIAPLGSALMSLLKLKREPMPRIGVQFADGAVNYRIQQILNPEGDLVIPVVHKRAVSISIVIMVLMLAMLGAGPCI
ncbi:M56 family metallopeptidase [Paenibacillus sepulcri]|uniref:M56 family metallopeptidase n=1 Tax=Paenibacillus sepulcri TaxID=359917 RepID=A0ABS7C8J0_9BACL|nr:M56 family metallopeptidase [Paenibacillus sepulcri]